MIPIPIILTFNLFGFFAGFVVTYLCHNSDQQQYILYVHQQEERARVR
jgi:uncharacterized membrane protein SpoIIM required for sporulation